MSARPDRTSGGGAGGACPVAVPASSPLPDRQIAKHGVVRGLDSVLRSSNLDGRFGRISLVGFSDFPHNWAIGWKLFFSNAGAAPSTQPEFSWHIGRHLFSKSFVEQDLRHR